MSDIITTPEEEWRPVEGWPYEVSSLGRVRRSKPACGTRVGYILRPARGTHGYPTVALFRAQEQRRCPVHVLVCEAFHGRRPSPTHQVAHNDGVRSNVNSDNLRWDTPAGNCGDRTLHGTENIGRRNGMSRLSDEDVLAMRRRVAAGENRYHVADLFGIHRNYLDQIIRRAARRVPTPTQTSSNTD